MTGDFTRRATLALLAIGILAAAGCGGEGAGDKTGRGRTVVISTGGDADNLFPPTHQHTQAYAVVDLLFEKLADIGPDLVTIGDKGRVPRLAERWEWSADSMSVTFHINPRARWHDGAPVRAGDVRFAFTVYADPKVGSPRRSDVVDVVDSISVQDSLTCTAWFRQRSPERFHMLTYNLKPLPEHLLGKIQPDSMLTSAFAEHPVGNGPFRFVRWDHGQTIEVAAADSFFLGRPSIDRVIWTIVPQNNVAVQRVMTGEADFIERVGADDIRTAATNADVMTTANGANQYGYIVFNLHDGDSNRPHPILANRELRRALTMAIDRRALVANVFDSLGRVSGGPFVRFHWSADSALQQIPFDPEAARKTLDSLGWRAGADGVREKGGRKLAFSVLAPESSAPRKNAAVVLQEQWKQIGVTLNVEALQMQAWSQQTRGRRFDATMFALGADPSPSGARQWWTTRGIAGGTNLGRYTNPIVDKAFDAAVMSSNLDSARAQYKTAYQTLLHDAPAIWLFEPAVFALVNKRLDVGTLRPDAWWSGIPNWRVSGDAR
jgi:peptide/nickel transport system substrate-binding protein